MAELSPTCPARGREDAGLTLIEVLCVMAILILLLSMAVTSSMDWGRGAGRRASIAGVSSSLHLARQWASAWSMPVTFTFGNVDAESPTEVGYYFLTTNGAAGVLGERNYLARGYRFDLSGETGLTVLPDGSCALSLDTNIVIREIRSTNYLFATLRVSKATATMSVVE